MTTDLGMAVFASRERSKVWALSPYDLLSDYRQFFPAELWTRAPLALEGELVTTRTFAHTAVDVSTNRITVTAHGMLDGQAVQFRNRLGTLPGGITKGTQYFVVNKTTNDFQVETSIGGGAVDITAQGNGTNTLLIQLHYDDPIPGFQENPSNPTLVMDGAFALAVRALTLSTSAPWWVLDSDMLLKNRVVDHEREHRLTFDYFQIFASEPIFAYRRRNGRGDWAFTHNLLTTDARTRGVFEPAVWERITVELTEPSLVQPAETSTDPHAQVNWQLYYLVDQLLQNRSFLGVLTFPEDFLVSNGIVTIRPTTAIVPPPAGVLFETQPVAITPKPAEVVLAALGPTNITPAPAEVAFDTGGPNP